MAVIVRVRGVSLVIEFSTRLQRLQMVVSVSLAVVAVDLYWLDLFNCVWIFLKSSRSGESHGREMVLKIAF